MKGIQFLTAVSLILIGGGCDQKSPIPAPQPEQPQPEPEYISGPNPNQISSIRRRLKEDISESILSDQEEAIVTRHLSEVEARGGPFCLIELSGIESQGDSAAEQARSAEAAIWKRLRARLATPDSEKPRVSLLLNVSRFPGNSSHFNVSKALTDRLKAAGIDVVDEGAKTVEGVLLIDYDEGPGEKYSDGTYSTEIRCRLHLLNLSLGARIGPLNLVKGFAPYEIVRGKTPLYAGAIENFKEWLTEGPAVDFVAAALGNREAYRKLLPLLLHRDFSMQSVVMQIGGRLEYTPQTPEEESYYVVSGRNYGMSIREQMDRTVELGAAAVPAISDYLDSLDLYDASKHRDTYAKDYAERLIKIGSPAAAPALVRVLERWPKHGFWQYRDQVVLALVTLGGAEDLKALEKVLKDWPNAPEFKKEILRSAADQLRARLGKATDDP